MLARLAVRLAEAADRGRPGPGTANVSRELRALIAQLSEAETERSYQARDELVARRAERRIGLMLDDWDKSWARRQNN
ncbi:hypothetical protein GCM10010521_40690 [Streptomyces rameus]|uniref:Uncharacterized protein n=1 Tax=Streptomyces rameus TaxID=68261 RepID=A0ABP6NIB8_9ACTN